MNYQDILAQALKLGFNPYAGDSNNMMARVGQYEVNPYFETIGQTEQDPGTSRQVGYTISDPLGGTTYRSDVVDMNGNLQRSNVHDAGADKYGLGDMAKMAAFAVGANALGSALGQNSMFSGGGLLGGSGAPALGGYDAAMADLAASGGLTPASMGAAGSAAAGGAAAGGVAAGGGSAAGSALGSMSGKVIGGLLGAAAGAANSGDKQQTTQQRLDPRMEALLYGADGKGGYLGAATDWFNQNKGGNPLMLQGAQMMADYYKSPQYTEGYNTLRNTGLGLLSMGMAGNPFLTKG